MSVQSLRNTIPHEMWSGPVLNLDQKLRIFDQFFGEVLPEEHVNDFAQYLGERLRHPAVSGGPCCWRLPSQTGTSEVINTANSFTMKLDVRHFAMKDIKVKVLGNERVVIHAKHEEKADHHGFIEREFTRQYIIPKEADPSTTVVTIHPDGQLSIRMAKRALSPPCERHIPIQFSHAQDGSDGDKEIDKL